MRDGLAGLTLRGRAFLAAGVTAICCAVLLGQPALTRIGCLVVALSLVAAFVVGRRRYALEVERSVQPRLVGAGQTARVDLVLANHGRSASGALMIEDHVPYALGSRPRVVVQGLARRWRQTVSYQVRSDVRGEFDIGPLTVRVADPFGLVEIRHTVPGTTPLVVTPRTVALPPIALAGGWTGAGEQRPQHFAAGSAEDVTVREYRRGDELRRVHWRSSARVGELMVRREEQPWEARATVLLDNRVRAHRGHGLASSFEYAVSAAASLVLHLDRHGYTVRLATATGTSPDAGESSSALLERLAVLTTTQHATLDTSWAGEATRGGLVVAVLGGPEASDTLALRQLRHAAGTALAVVLDVDQWSGRTQRQAAPPMVSPVAGLGWRAVTVGPRDRLDTAWRDLGRASGRSAAAMGGLAGTGAIDR